MKICKKIMIILMMCSIIISNITLDVIAQKEDVITEPQSLMEVEKPEARMYDREGNEIVQGIPESVVEPVKELVGLENTQRARTVTPPEVEAAALELRAGMIERQSEIVINVNAGTSWNKDELVDMVLNKALENTENGYEGDYLQWDIKSSTTRVFVNNDDYELKFSFEYYTSYEQEQEIEEAVAEIIASLGITEETSDFDKIKKVYEWITFNVEYDWDNVLGEAGIEHSAYAAVIDRIAVCQGYSKLLYRMLKEVDIENRIVIGETGVEGILHMWNIVELNGKYYFCDSTSENAGHYDFFLKGRYDFPGYSCYEEYYEAFDIAEMGYPVSHEDSVTKDGFVYQIVADEVLLKGYIGENVNVVVPAEIEGYAVKEIAMYAFYGNHTIETLEFSEGIERMNSESIFNCSKLVSLHFPSTMVLASIGSDSVLTGLTVMPIGCNKLETVTVAKDNPYAVVCDGVVYTKDMKRLMFFPTGDKRESFTIPDGVEIINNSSFEENFYLKEIIMPDTVRQIGYWAFNGTGSLKKINFSPNLEVIGQYAFNGTQISSVEIPEKTELIIPAAFWGMNHLEDISVHPDNLEYYDDDGILIHRLGSIICYPPQRAGDEYILPDNIKSLEQGAFRHAEKLEKLILNEGLEYIYNHALAECYSLSSIELPDTVTTIESNAITSGYVEKGVMWVYIPASVTEIETNIVSDGTIIYGEEGSKVEGYAKENNICFADINDPIIRGTCGANATWTYNPTGLLKIEGTGDIDDYEMCQHPWFLMRRAILEVQISEGIESIGTYAFQEMWRTTTISVPKSVNHISDTAFEQLYQTKIMCYANSYTEEYAKVHNISYDTFCEEKNPISSHSYGEWTITEEPTCDTFGSRRRTCNVCGYVKMENVQPLGHDFENGKCKVCGCLDPESIDVPSEPLRFSSASLTLQDNIAINLKARTTLFTEVGYTDPYVVFELNGVETVVTESYTSGKNTVFDFTNIAPHQMNDRVTATLYAKYNGEEYEGYSYVYGVFAYCDNMLSKYTTDEYAKLRTLLVDLLNYGAESQMYTGYKTDNLVNGFLTEEQKAWGTASSRTYENLLAPAYETINHPSVTWKAAGLNLKDRVEIRVKFLADDINNLVIKVRDDNGNNWEIKADKFEAIPEGGYYAYFNGLNAGMMSEPVYFTVYDGEQKVSNTLRYSVESYAYSKVNGTDAALSTLVQAMMKYGDAAYSYVN